MKHKLISLLKSILIMTAILAIAAVVQNFDVRFNIVILAIVSIYGVYIIYRAYVPKRRYYFVSYKCGEIIGNMSFPTKKSFWAKEVKKRISNHHSSTEYVCILFYKEISEEEHKLNTL